MIYSAYYLTAGFKNDTSLQTIMAAIQHSTTAHAVLGDHIALNGVPTYNFRYDAGGRSASYTLELQGDKSGASAHADVTISDGEPMCTRSPSPRPTGAATI